MTADRKRGPKLGGVGWAVAGVLALLGCEGDRAPAKALDLIFVIEDSGSMHEEQDSLGRGFAALIEALQAAAGGLPDTRIAIVSSNLGAGPGVPELGCPRRGDEGRFKVRAGCGLEGASFLSVDGKGNQNFAGPLTSTFGCLAGLGSGGCGYEHTLQSLRVALEASDPRASGPAENRGFLRPEAALGIVLLGIEDDCSGEVDATFYQGAVPGQGPSLRCAVLGHVCNGQPVVPSPDFQAPLSSCEPYRRKPGERTSRLIDVQELAGAVKAVKGGHDGRILVSAIVGWDASPGAVYRLHGRPEGAGLTVNVGPICLDPSVGDAAPAVRTVAFTRSFRHHSVHSICTPSLAGPMAEIGRALAGVTGQPR